jgi:cation diffusion facilitator CzcD-associated flavoprotein CzcO
MTSARDMQKKMIDVAIIGAGPYGLSIAAHLRARGVTFRIFGSPMSTWLTQMPRGMRLKSEGFASSLSDPDSTLTLGQYCKEASIPYADLGLPVALTTFVSYGLEFQRRFVPTLEDTRVTSLRRLSTGFEIDLSSGEIVSAHKVVLAVGISHFGYVPPVLASLPCEFVSHSSQHSVLDQFEGREVAIVGAGASALDLAALLRHTGASVQLIARKPVIRFHDPPTGAARTLLQRIKLPMTGIGSGWRLTFYTYAPQLFHLLPERLRLAAVRKTLGPAPAWFVKEDVVGHIPFHPGVKITAAKIQDDRVNLELTDSNGTRRNLMADHVIAATGYKVDLRRLNFIDSDVQEEIRLVERSPVLSLSFESSVRGLYFVGTSAANSFGPLMRFAYGAEFVARRLSKHLAKSASRGRVRRGPAVQVPSGESGQPLKETPNG